MVAMMAGLEHATGEGIVTMSGDRTHHRAAGTRINRIASPLNRLPAGAWNRAGQGSPPARIDSRR
jgi:hypothetical protein